MAYYSNYRSNNQNSYQSNNRRSDGKDPSPTRALWRHVFFIERVLQLIALKSYGSKEAFRKDFYQWANESDSEMFQRNLHELVDDELAPADHEEGLPFR